MAEAGVEATILAPWQADAHHLDNRQPYRVDVGGGRHITVLFYDADLSAAVSFEPAMTADADRFARERIAPRLGGSLHDGRAPMLVIASDGELYGHHQSFRDLFLHRLVAPSETTPDRGYDVVTLAAVAEEAAGHPHPEIRIRDRTSWSCHHGVLRWSGECPDAADGRWKAPLRAALERLAGGIDTATEALVRELPGHPDIWAARDRYVDVVIGAQEGDAFAAATLGARSSAEDRRGCSRCSRPSAGASGCSRRAAGSGRSRSGRRPARCCGRPPGPRGWSTASRARAWSAGWWRTSPRSCRPGSGSTARRSTATRSARSGSPRRTSSAGRARERSPGAAPHRPGNASTPGRRRGSDG